MYITNYSAGEIVGCLQSIAKNSSSVCNYVAKKTSHRLWVLHNRQEWTSQKGKRKNCRLYITRGYTCKRTRPIIICYLWPTRCIVCLYYIILYCILWLMVLVRLYLYLISYNILYYYYDVCRCAILLYSSDNFHEVIWRRSDVSLGLHCKIRMRKNCLSHLWQYKK